MKKFRNIALIIVLLAVSAYVLIAFYPYIFSRRVVGEISAVEKVATPMTVVTMGGQDPSSQIFSFAVGVRDEKTGEIVTGSTEDRQWAVARQGQCAEAVFFPYPPWQMEKWGTYYNARLVRLYDCAPRGEATR